MGDTARWLDEVDLISGRVYVSKERLLEASPSLRRELRDGEETYLA